MALSGMPDQHNIVAKALAWDAEDVTALDELCDLIMAAVDHLDEGQAVRTASSVLLANADKLPVLHRTVCEFAFASTSHGRHDLQAHLQKADGLLEDLVAELEPLRKRTGVFDARIGALGVRVEELRRMAVVQQGPPEDESATAGVSAASLQPNSLVEPQKEVSRPIESARNLTPPPAANKKRPALIKPPAHAVKRSATATSQRSQNIDSISVAAFYALSCCSTTGGIELVFDRECSELDVYEDGKPRVIRDTQRPVSVGPHEADRVYFNHGSSRVYVTGSYTNVSNGQICIAFNQQGDVSWFLARIAYATRGRATRHEVTTDELDKYFAKQSHDIFQAYERTLKAQGLGVL